LGFGHRDPFTFEEGSGGYDHRDAAGFIRLNALRLRIAAKRKRRSSAARDLNIRAGEIAADEEQRAAELHRQRVGETIAEIQARRMRPRDWSPRRRCVYSPIP